MSINFRDIPSIPVAPGTIQKGVPLKHLLDAEAVHCLARNISFVYPQFDSAGFYGAAMASLERLELLERGKKLAQALHQFLPQTYSSAVEILLASLTPPLESTDNNGLAVFFYLPHVCFVAEYGLDPGTCNEDDTFDVSIRAQYELTRRFSAEFSIRHFLIRHQERTLKKVHEWLTDPCPHVRRLCSEGTRPRLPWAIRIPSFISNPEPILPILEALKDDPSLYVRRSVANNLGDIAKDHPDLAFGICERWLIGASKERKWLIRHALRHPAKKGHPDALQLRTSAKP
ncbi:DNA alkylation repair protein [Methylobacter sp. BlB1]|uniref:DNA alkylation repair protein n=1 Tax=Methylobacter sp. BlB1 TaxID=2785914 RepID=UPI001894C00D|nr:DNA alkylation repair protein [Methylobacter sp. BlB1]MBF6651192.1 DNA alkylation repair protein [Methylobacter sp. BlB1]